MKAKETLYIFIYHTSKYFCLFYAVVFFFLLLLSCCFYIWFLALKHLLFVF